MNENEIITREFFESPAYLSKKEQLNKEINSRVLEVDYKIFKKDSKEKDRTMELKLKNRFERKRKYGAGEYKKYLNTPESQILISQWFAQTDRFHSSSFEGPIKMTF